MNILLIINVSSDYPGNLLTSIWKLQKELEKNESRVIYLFPEAARSLKWIAKMQEDGNTVYFKKSGLKNICVQMRKIVNKHNIDIAYLHFWSLNDCLAMKYSKIRNGSLHTIIHHHNEYHISNSFLNEIIKKWILNVDMHVGCSDYIAEQVKNAGYKNVLAINNCIDFDRLQKYEDIDIFNGLTLITFSSYGYEIKGIDISIKAVGIARNEGLNVALAVVVSAKWDEIEKKIKEECGGSVPSWIIMLPARSDVATYYHAADAYLNSSRSEGLCAASAEAVFCGAQVIQTNIPMNRLDIPETLIYKVEDIADLVCKIRELKDETDIPNLDRKKRQKDYIISNYSISQWIRSEMKVFKQLLDE